jgi:hypothetical protein
VEFEWDEEKNRRNLAKHGLRFETASRALLDPRALREIDLDAPGEVRVRLIGAIRPGTIIFVVYVDRGDDFNEVARIISARHADSRERRRYEQDEGR